MALSDLTSAGSVIITLSSKIQSLGGEWYKSSAAWASFPEQLELLRRKQNDLVSEVSRHVMLHESCESKLIDQVLYARSLLESEVSKLKTQKKARCSACFPTLSLISFPEPVLETVQSVTTLFDGLTATFRPREEVRTVLTSPVMNQKMAAPIPKDTRFINYDALEACICQALEDPSRPTVVLLHGDGGQGKTVAARNIAMYYRGKARAWLKGTQNAPPEENFLFQHVIFLECGPEADPGARFFEVLRELGVEGRISPGEDQKSYGRGGDVSIRTQLAGLLKDQSILMILDDVCETKFLQAFVELIGKGVKCLVTTQDETLWLESYMIEMSVGPDDARRILASHVGLPGKVIPLHLKEIADRLVDATEAHPLSLASLANALSARTSSDVDEWMDAERDVQKLLQYVEETAPNLNKKYPRTFWASMRVCVGQMPEEEQKLLLLTAFCEGPSIPEEVLRTMCESSNLLKVDSFDQLRNDLEERSLIVIETQSLPWADATSQLTQRRWSLHRLQKQFLRHEMSKESESFVDLFLGETEDSIAIESEDAKLLKVLCALYFDKSVCKRAAAKWGISFKNFSERRRLAIEPLTWLIQKHNDQATYLLARKVLLEYICNEQVEDSDIALLLRTPRSAAATCWTLEIMFWVTENSMIGDEEEGMISALVHLLGEGNDRNSREKALRVLVNVAAKATADQRIRQANFPGLLDGIVKILNRFQSEAEVSSLYKQQDLATRVLNFLASEEENKARIAEFPFALDVLVRCILKDDAVASPEMQEHASVTVAILAGANGTQTKRKILEFPGVLGGLVKLLNKDDSPRAQQSAAAALAYLSVNVGEKNNRRIAQYPYALSGLVNLLFKDQSPVSQMWAAWALTNLSVEEINRKEIVEFPYALPRFVRLLSKDDCPDVQKWCASALAMLALDEQCNRKIAEFPDALSRLVNLLHQDKALQVQTWAAWALSNLSADPQTMAQICKFPYAITRVKELTLKP